MSRPALVTLLPRLLAGLLPSAVAVALLGGCGHPATDEECKALFDKSVEVEMRELAKADEVTIAKKKEELRKGFESDLKACVGKRVTDSSMNCVRKATTAAELTDCSR